MNRMKIYLKILLIPLLLVVFTTDCENRVGITSPPIITVPTVSSTNPINATTDVAFNQKITATFSEAMDSLTITTATFTLMQGTSFVSGTVSYTGITATFTPSSNLAPMTSYTATITTGAKDIESTTLNNNYVWSFTTGAAAVITPPTISSTDPVNAATAVPINQKISATFSVGMDASTITASTFTLRQGTTSVSGFVSYSGITAIFAPANNLAQNTAYTCTITTGTKDLAGNALAVNYTWSFTTGAATVEIPPTVSSTDPANAETGVALNQKISATFNKTMDASTISTSSFKLMQGSTTVSGVVSFSGRTALFTPLSNLVSAIEYSVTITTEAKDLAGNALANNYVWNFTTGTSTIITLPTVSSTDPANIETGVALNQKIAATFSKTMDASTITTSTFTLMQGTTSVSGSVSYTGTTATFSPASNLMPSSTYSATITNETKDLAGNAMASNYVWSFTTGAAVVIVAPTVISTDPVNAATEVALNQKIAATFSTTMDASTITTTTFILRLGTTPISGQVSYSGTTATFAPVSELVSNSIYSAAITNEVNDLAGNSMESNYIWSFTTGTVPIVTPPTVISTNPVDAATDVALNKEITATFSKTMDASTITTLTFTLMQGTTNVSGVVNYVGTLATFVPSSNLTESTIYTATITTGAKDLAGNPIESDNVWNFTTGAAIVPVGQPPVNLGSVARFAILSNSAITNIPTSSITGDVGISPGSRSSIAGLTNPEVIGTIFAADDADPVPAMLIAAKTAAEAAYLDAVASVRGTPTPISGNINGLTLVPGLYESGTSVEISPAGILYLDAQGDGNAVFIIRSATSITTEATSEVVLTNGANAANIYWVAGSSVTLGVNSKMKGTIIASTSISLLTGSRLDGRALIQGAAAGQVSLDQCTIVLP